MALTCFFRFFVPISKNALGILVLLLAATPVSSAWASRDLSKCELYAVVVGVGECADKDVPVLQHAEKDARDFYAFLQERQGQFAKAHLKLLTGKEATKGNLTMAIREGLKPAGKDDVVIVYLSGHGLADPGREDEYYFVTYDTEHTSFCGTGLPVDRKLFKGIDSDRVLLLSDACHSGGFNPAIEKAMAKSWDALRTLFQSWPGRLGMSSSRADEKSYEIRRTQFNNSVFTHYLLKGLRGDAPRNSPDGVITLGELFHYVYEETRKATKGKQNPQLFSAKGRDDDTPIFKVPTYSDSLKIKVQFVAKTDDEKVIPLTNDSVLKSGQRIGLAFKADSDCYVYVYWWDSAGKVGRLFPNPKLTEGTGHAKAGTTYWLPSQGGKLWYVLDKNIGDETIYFVASRESNKRLESLYDELHSLSAADQAGMKGAELTQAIGQQYDFMGIEDYTVVDKDSRGSHPNREQLFEALENQVKIAGADAVFRIKFRHVDR